MVEQAQYLSGKRGFNAKPRDHCPLGKMHMRWLRVPPEVTGYLYLDSMPGRYEEFHQAERRILEAGVTRVVCLASGEEIRQKSPAYARAREQASLSWERADFPIDDYGAPEDRAAFLLFVEDVANRVRAGDHILVHCGAGIGRTGMLAVCVLMALGLTKQIAIDHTHAAGSRPERPSQWDAVSWVHGQTTGS